MENLPRALWLRGPMLRKSAHSRRFSSILLLGVVLAAHGFSNGCVETRTPDPKVRYVAFGDSTTVGPTARDYPDILREILGESAETFANEGRWGETSKDGLERLRGLLERDVYPNARVWLYWEGGNDVVEFIQARDPRLLVSPDDLDYPFRDDLAKQLAEIQANIESAIAILRGSEIRPYVATYFFVHEGLSDCPALPVDVVLPLQAQRANAYILRLNERIRMAVSSQDAILVDVGVSGEKLRSNPANYRDCNHLSVQGNEIVAGVFAEAIAASSE